MLHSALPPAEALTLVPLADIARGGMGIVQLCRATDGRLSGRALAVKRLNPALEEEPEFVNMFLDETWITATINSPHVVKVEAWGRDDAGLFLAVELVEGVSLSRLVKESREKHEPFAERTVAFIASQVCAGLEAAHELRGDNGSTLGLVHRDLTPGNILISFDGKVKIADFGIAKAEERLTNTRIGMMKGKPAYMAPEQARGGGIDGRADLFALGVVMFELLTGRRPWVGANDLETLVNVTTKDPPPLAELRKTSPIFVEIVEKCLKKPPHHRFASAGEIRAKLDAWRRERGFDADDQASLAAFVQRNTQQQQTWFRDALGGQLARGGVTFMDLEAHIDRGRKHASTVQPAASTAPLTTPTPSSHGAPGSHPASGSLSSTYQSAGNSGPIASRPAGSGPAATVAMSMSALTPGAGQDADDDAKTMYIPSSSGSFKALAPQSGGLGSTIALTPEEAAAMSARHGSGPMQPVPLHATGGVSAGPSTPPPRNLDQVVTVVDETAATAPYGRPRRRSRVGIALALVAVLCVAAAAVYYFVVRPRQDHARPQKHALASPSMPCPIPSPR